MLELAPVEAFRATLVKTIHHSLMTSLAAHRESNLLITNQLHDEQSFGLYRQSQMIRF